MNLKCLIGLHKYHSQVIKSGDNYIKKCSNCGHIKNIDINDLDLKFKDDYNQLQILFDLLRHNVKNHNTQSAYDILERIELIYKIFEKKYENYEKKYQLKILYDKIQDYHF